ncbi:hypothetical protein RHMOL_Rhmol01G0045800 [Rhododendron molle]|uniref:Uncharacterized protein n=1 Tax=Rhododendron molle TaxID=49168 RepID=A0ACC0PXV6_RHOML|nr:hypothetical protein RHMOL_Rhmol01G0045800 [Rhododendron molle]
MTDNELRTTITAGVTLGIDFEEEDIMSVREMIEGDVQEFARLPSLEEHLSINEGESHRSFPLPPIRRAKRSNSFTEFEAAMLTVLSAFQLLSFGGLRIWVGFVDTDRVADDDGEESRREELFATMDRVLDEVIINIRCTFASVGSKLDKA